MATADGLRGLLLVDELLVETAGPCSAEDVDGEGEFGVAGRKAAGVRNGDAKLRELDGVGDGGAFLLRGNRRRGDV